MQHFSKKSIFLHLFSYFLKILTNPIDIYKALIFKFKEVFLWSCMQTSSIMKVKQ